MSETMRNCTRCGELLPVDAFYFVSKKTGKRRGQCKPCLLEVKRQQREPDWLPECNRCGERRPRFGPGRRLCEECFTSAYDAESPRGNGAHRERLRPCSACGHVRLRADHVPGTSLCPICRSVPQSRRAKLRYFNMTPREFVALLAAQGDACAICVRPANKGRSLHIDHSHGDPPLVRGVICNVCNTMLGLARDNAERLRAAAFYLEYPPAQAMYPGRAAIAAPRDSWNTFHPLKRVKKGVAA